MRVSDRTRLIVNLEPGEVRETTSVTSQAPLIESASNTLGGTIGGAQVQNLPLNGRDINVLLAQAAAMGGYSNARQLFDKAIARLAGDTGLFDPARKASEAEATVLVYNGEETLDKTSDRIYIPG